MKISKSASNLLLAVFLLTTFSCGSDESGAVLSRITIESSIGSRIDLNESTTLTATGFDQNEGPVDVEGRITWEASNSNVSIDDNGLVRGVALGSTVITGRVEDVEGTITIQVWDSSAPRTEIFVSDVGVDRNGPHQILRYYDDGEFVEVFISDRLSRPQDIVFLEDQGAVLVSNLSSNNINKYNSETGAFIETFANGIGQPTRMDIGPDGYLYVIQWSGDGFVRRYDLDGTFIDNFTDVGVDQSIGIAWDDSGNMYVSSFNDGNNNGFVRKFDTNGNDLGLFISSNLNGPTDIWFDSSGNLLINDWSDNRVKMFNSDGGFVRTFISNVQQPEGVAFMDDGTILIGQSGNGSIPQYSSTGSFRQNLVNFGGGGLETPNAVVLRQVNVE